jgi:hypothetical protein
MASFHFLYEVIPRKSSLKCLSSSNYGCWVEAVTHDAGCEHKEVSYLTLSHRPWVCVVFIFVKSWDNGF